MSWHKCVHDVLTLHRALAVFVAGQIASFLA